MCNLDQSSIKIVIGCNSVVFIFICKKIKQWIKEYKGCLKGNISNEGFRYSWSCQAWELGGLVINFSITLLDIGKF